jgi:hypothetical protein
LSIVNGTVVKPLDHNLLAVLVTSTINRKLVVCIYDLIFGQWFVQINNNPVFKVKHNIWAVTALDKRKELTEDQNWPRITNYEHYNNR